MAVYNDAPQVILSFDWRGGDFKYFFSFVIEIKLFCPISAINFDLRQICAWRGGGVYVRLFLFAFASACILVKFWVAGINLFLLSSLDTRR